MDCFRQCHCYADRKPGLGCAVQCMPLASTCKTPTHSLPSACHVLKWMAELACSHNAGTGRPGPTDLSLTTRVKLHPAAPPVLNSFGVLLSPVLATWASSHGAGTRERLCAAMHAAAFTGAGLAEGPVCKFAALPDTGSTAHRPRRGNYPAYMLWTLQHHDASRAPRAHIISTDGSERRPGPASAPFLGLRSRTSDSCMPWRAMCGRQAITPFPACTAQHGHEESLGLPCSHVTLSRPNNGGCLLLVKSDSIALANMLCMHLAAPEAPRSEHHELFARAPPDSHLHGPRVGTAPAQQGT